MREWVLVEVDDAIMVEMEQSAGKKIALVELCEEESVMRFTFEDETKIEIQGRPEDLDS